MIFSGVGRIRDLVMAIHLFCLFRAGNRSKQISPFAPSSLLIVSGTPNHRAINSKTCEDKVASHLVAVENVSMRSILHIFFSPYGDVGQGGSKSWQCISSRGIGGLEEERGRFDSGIA